MGKLSKLQKSKKHKKLKTVQQPYANKHKNRDKNVVDQRPSNTEDQEVPHSVREVMRLRNQTKEGKFKRKRSKGKNLQQEHEAQDSPDSRFKPMKAAPVFKQGKRESDRQFMQRVDRTVQAVIHKAQFEDKFDVDLDEQKDGKMEIKKKTKPKSEHKQLREQERKEKRKAKKFKKEEKKLTGFEKCRDEVQFGEVAMAPPSLTAKPRKVPQGDNNRPGARSLLLKEVLSESKHKQASASAPQYRPRQVGKTVKRKHLPMVQQRIMDGERQRAIDLYRHMKGHTQKLPAS